MVTTTPLVCTRDAIASGTRARLYRDHSVGALTRVRRGVYVKPEALDAQVASEARYRTVVEAVAAARGAPVITSVSATAFLGLPLLGAPPPAVYLLAPGTSGRKRNGVIELARRGDEDVVECGALRMTSVPLSIVQACRHTTFATALAIVESAVHVNRFGHAAPLTTLDELAECYRSRLPFPRSARVRAVLEFATALSDTPLETLSKLRIHELGFPAPVQQHELWLPRLSRRAFIDFAWPQYRIAGEADGWGKYVDPRYAGGADPIERVKREKLRDDAIRGLRWTPVHWDWNEAMNADALERILLGAGLPRVSRPRVIV